MSHWNVTFEPSEMAIAVADPEIREVRNTRSGLTVGSVRLISQCRYDRLVRLRNFILDRMQQGTARITCAICGTPVYLVATPSKAFFFRHKVEDGSCPALTRGEWTRDEIRGMKYLGARESDAHRYTKRLTVRSLRADPNFYDVDSERVWRSLTDRTSWRKPDVQARFQEHRLAFEIQLTTTFLDVVVQRRSFYRSEGALLIWVLRRFDPHDRRMTEDDICFPNNSNVFVIDEETTRLSEQSRRCLTRCFYRKPFITDGKIIEQWQQAIVPIDMLHFEYDRQRAWWFDFEGEYQKLQAQLERTREEEARRRNQDIEEKRNALRQDVLTFWMRNGGWEHHDEDEDKQWRHLAVRLAGEGLLVPDCHRPSDFRNVVLALLSAKLGRPIGFGYRKLVEVAHYLAESHPGFLIAFGWATRVFGTNAVIVSEDKSGAWAQKAKVIHTAIALADPRYRPDQTWTPALTFLFPEIAEKIQTIPAQYVSS